MTSMTSLTALSTLEITLGQTQLLRVSPLDNVLIVIQPLHAGDILDVEGEPVVVDQDLPLGFKVAAVALPEGSDVVRAGTVIGRTTADVALGAMLHTHNLKSLYLRTHERGEQ